MQRSRILEEFVGPIALHPGFERRDVSGVAHLPERNLVRAERALDLLSVDFAGSSPSLGRRQHDHRPLRPTTEAVARLSPNRRDVLERALERIRQERVHGLGLLSFDEERRVSVAA